LLKTVYSAAMASPLSNEVAERTRIFRALVPYFGTIQPSAFFSADIEFIAGVQRIHPFIEGIYKPRDQNTRSVFRRCWPARTATKFLQRGPNMVDEI